MKGVGTFRRAMTAVTQAAGKFTRNIFGRVEETHEALHVAPKLRVTTKVPVYPVVAFKKDKRLPLAARMHSCGEGYFLKQHNHAPLSGPAPTVRAAERAALRNLGVI